MPSRVKHRGSRRFTYQALKALLHSIKEQAQPLDPRRDLVSMRTLARQSEMTAIQILQRILDRQVSYVSYVGPVLDLETIRIDRAEFTPKALVRSASFLSPRQAAKQFRMTRPTLRKLASMNLLSTSERFDPTNKSVHPFYDPDEIQQFLSQHISLMDLAKRMKRHAPSLRRGLKSEGITPLFEKCDILHATFYARSDIERLGLI